MEYYGKGNETMVPLPSGVIVLIASGVPTGPRTGFMQMDVGGWKRPCQDE